QDTTPVPDRKQRKSVAFTDEQVVVDVDGSVTMVNATEEPKETAQSHTPRTPPLAAALEALHADANSQAGAEDATASAPDAAVEDGGLDLSMKKKKKKKKTTEDAEDDEFATRVAALGLEGTQEGGEAAEATADDGDMDAGTGIWQHDETKALSYSLLLNRFFHQLSQKNPDHALSGSKSYKIPPPQCMREGNKKTIFANIAEICKRMKRTEEHVTAYLFSELGTSGSVDGSRRLVIKGRFQQKQLENVLRKYIIEYVTCKTCKSADTELSKGENRLYFITCNSCGSRRSVTAIKTGFSAQIGKRRKMQG
ncbi:domain found in IF2B/IF5-domain-containing protein, partial [Colletotrichum cereale]